MNIDSLEPWLSGRTARLPRNDLVPGLFTARVSPLWSRLQSLVARKFHPGFSDEFWSRHPLLPVTHACQAINEAIGENKPYAVARLGAVEAQILLWAKGIPLTDSPLNLPHLFLNTMAGAGNAGIRPRNKKSYMLYADLAVTSLQTLDMMACWKTSYEASALTHTGLTVPVCNGEELSPTLPVENHWICSLENKKILVVSPFKNSIERQLPRMSQIWKDTGWSPQFTVQTIKFPWLIEEDFPDPWWSIYEKIGKIILSAEYDIALFGCGGLGLPLAALAKSAGKVGLHLGGHLQLLFGIYGQRHVEQEWHRRLINDAWVRPSGEEVPPCAARVENSCYW